MKASSRTLLIGCIAHMAAAFVNIPAAQAQTYSSEFVNRDGSSISCHTSVYASGHSSSTQCSSLTAEQRIKVLDAKIAGYERLNNCADQHKAEGWSKLPLAEQNDLWDVCMGRQKGSTNEL